jgi:hypothetical protein
MAGEDYHAAFLFTYSKQTGGSMEYDIDLSAAETAIDDAVFADASDGDKDDPRLLRDLSYKLSFTLRAIVSLAEIPECRAVLKHVLKDILSDEDVLK